MYYKVCSGTGHRKRLRALGRANIADVEVPDVEVPALKTALLVLLVTTMPACITVVRIPCETDPCGVTTSAARPRKAEQIQIVRKGEPMPAGAKMRSVFEAPPAAEPCSDASLAFIVGQSGGTYDSSRPVGQETQGNVAGAPAVMLGGGDPTVYCRAIGYVKP